MQDCEWQLACRLGVGQVNQAILSSVAISQKQPAAATLIRCASADAAAEACQGCSSVPVMHQNSAFTLGVYHTTC